MAEDAAGCIGAVLAIAAVGWVPLHFSGKSILYWRETKEIREIYDSSTCRYFNSTGAESPSSRLATRTILLPSPEGFG
jgi:hypothetical protein